MPQAQAKHVWTGAAIAAALALFGCTGGFSLLTPETDESATEAILCAQRAVQAQLAPSRVSFVPLGQVAQRRRDGTYAVSGSIWQERRGRRVRSHYAVVTRPDPVTGRMVCIRCLTAGRL